MSKNLIVQKKHYNGSLAFEKQIVVEVESGHMVKCFCCGA